MTSACDGILVALGVREPSPTSREALRLVMLGTMSPDARVWPLKLTRLLASHGADGPSAADRGSCRRR